MKSIFSKIVFTIIILNCIQLNAQYYVSPPGNDSNNGSIESPFKTIQKAFAVLGSSGGTIYLREGVYYLSSTLKTEKAGTAESYNKLWAYPGEKPVIDFSAQTYSSSSRGINLARQYWHLKGLEVRYAGDNGINIAGSYNIVENCVIHHNKDTGLQIGNGASYNKIINCDSYLNYDPNSHGENADGFAPKLDIGPGNEFIGCRAYLNSDDGWDCYEGQSPVIIDSCWAFHNGYNIWNDSNYAGDGNGFKMGGNYIPAAHIIKNSIAFDNKSKGFDQNHNTAGITLYNCTAWRNGRNFAFGETPKTGVNILKNNISYLGSNSLDNTSIQENNSWQGFNISDSDFIGLDTSLARAPRDSSGKMIPNNLLRLSAASSMIDAGIDVGIPYYGTAPDLGAFESTGATGVEKGATLRGFNLEQNYPNPFNPSTTISYTILSESDVSIDIFNLLGQRIKSYVYYSQSAGRHQVSFNASNLSSGIYFYKITAGGFGDSKKMIYLR